MTGECYNNNNNNNNNKTLHISSFLQHINIVGSGDIFGPMEPVIGQVRSECLTCTFRASCCSARLSRAQVHAVAGSHVRDKRKKRGGGGGGGRKGDRLPWRVQGSSSSPTGIGSRRRTCNMALYKVIERRWIY